MVASGPRVFAVVVLLAGAGMALERREKPEILPPHASLAAFPIQIGAWQGTDMPLGPDVLSNLGPGEYLLRNYRNSGSNFYVNLFVAFFPSQRFGDTIHSPQNCLPGAGWVPVRWRRVELTPPGGQKILVNRYVVQQGMDQLLVLYWYQAHGRVTPSEYTAKVHLATDAIRMNRTDGALVRVLTTIGRGESEASAENRAVALAQDTLPLLDDYIPR